jgi:hypothetical protein
MQSETRQCQNCKIDFVIEQEDFNFYEKIKIPPPTFCPLCRAQRRFSFRNERKFFKVRDAFTGEYIFSTVPENDKKKVIDRETWFGDSWNGMEHGMDYDFSKNFFKQFFELNKLIPIYNLNTKQMVNSPYCGNATGLKNCYLCFSSTLSENCMYGSAVDFSKDCIDNSHVNHSERSYENFWLQNCYQCHFSVRSMESRNLWFCRECVGCNDCFGCVNLRKASYCIFNKQYSKEEYRKEIEKLNLNTISGLKRAREKARAFWYTKPTKYHQGLKNLDSTGSYVTHSKNVNDSYLIRESENLRYCQYLQTPDSKDCYDTSNWGAHMELNYETMQCGDNSYNVKFSLSCWPSCSNIEYCMDMFSSSDCFCCVGLKKKQYCILNKQYSKDEYFVLVEKIKKHMDEFPYVDSQGLVYKYGEFFPIESSYLGYNNAVAFQHFPLTKEEAEQKGYSWIEIPRGEYKITEKTDDLPDCILDVSDEILKEVIECENCKRAYKILEDELIFLKKENLPLPTMCNDCRYERRIKDRLKVHLYKRSCMCAGEFDKTGVYKNTATHEHGSGVCEEEFKTGYPPNHPEIVYCEKCYQKEVY